MKFWIVLFAIAVASVRAQDLSHENDGFSSKELEDLYDEGSDDDFFNQLFDGKEIKNSADDILDDTETLDKDEEEKEIDYDIESYRNKPDEDNDNLDNYQFEDNRSKMKNEDDHQLDDEGVLEENIDQDSDADTMSNEALNLDEGDENDANQNENDADDSIDSGLNKLSDLTEDVDVLEDSDDDTMSKEALNLDKGDENDANQDENDADDSIDSGLDKSPKLPEDVDIQENSDDGTMSKEALNLGEGDETEANQDENDVDDSIDTGLDKSSDLAKDIDVPEDSDDDTMSKEALNLHEGDENYANQNKNDADDLIDAGLDKLSDLAEGVEISEDNDDDTMSKEVNNENDFNASNVDDNNDDDTLSNEDFNNQELADRVKHEKLETVDSSKGKDLDYDDYASDIFNEKKTYDIHLELEDLFDTWNKLSDDSKEKEDQDEGYDNNYDSSDVNNNESVVEPEDDQVNFGNADSEANDSDSFESLDKPLAKTTTTTTNNEMPNIDLNKIWRDIAPEDAQKSETSTILSKNRTEEITSFIAETQTGHDILDAINNPKFTEQLKQDLIKQDAIEPTHVVLSTSDPVVITSPNYPANYPTNSFVEWILDGEGNGIELNLTDLNLRGAQNDYLLIIPGGNPDSVDGLLFTWHLREPRNYRFFDVNSVVVRFVSGGGLIGLSGFKMTVKIISSLPEEKEDDLPDPESLLPPPTSVMSVSLGGVSLPQFRSIQEEFRRLVADMATMYINANGLDMGLNTTQEITQLTSVSICNIEWPGFEYCVAVSFAVPLVSEDGEPQDRLNEEDLMAMWYTYVDRDPFASRLRRLGVTMFSVPNDRQAMASWLFISSAVVLTMAVLAFVLWRGSFFRNYTRMSVYGDTDSVFNEKRIDDLYPTPHQTLPPLYADEKFDKFDDKFDDSTRVDMGGYANRSYMRDDPYESDEEAKRNRYTTDV